MLKPFIMLSYPSSLILSDHLKKVIYIRWFKADYRTYCVLVCHEVNAGHVQRNQAMQFPLIFDSGSNSYIVNPGDVLDLIQ